MDIEITLKNYRCFPDSNPARFTLGKGFTGFVGVNNSGKSSLLKFFYEFRSLFQTLSSHIENLISALGNNPQAFGLPPSVFDINELFCNSNERNLEIEIRITPEGSETETHPLPIVTRAVIKVPRGTNTWLAELYTEEGRFHDDRGFGFEAPILRRGTDTATGGDVWGHPCGQFLRISRISGFGVLNWRRALIHTN